MNKYFSYENRTSALYVCISKEYKNVIYYIICMSYILLYVLKCHFNTTELVLIIMAYSILIYDWVDNNYNKLICMYATRCIDLHVHINL